MSDMTAPPLPAPTYMLSTGSLAGQRFSSTVRSEITKLRSLRSTAWVLAVTVVGALLVTALSANHARGRHFFQDFDPTNMSLQGLAIASLSLGLLGALAITGEFGTGTIRSSLSATPRRLRFIVSKLSVVGLLSLLVGEALSFSCFFLGQGILSGSSAPTAHLGQPGVLRAVALSGAYLALLALFALGIGLIVRHTAGAIGAYVGVTLLLPVLLQAVGGNPNKFAPEWILANSVAAVVPQQNVLAAPVGFMLMAVYAVASLGIGVALLLRRDA